MSVHVSSPVREIIRILVGVITYRSARPHKNLDETLEEAKEDYNAAGKTGAPDIDMPEDENLESRENEEQEERKREEREADDVLRGETPIWCYLLNRILGYRARSVPEETKERIMDHCAERLVKTLCQDHQVVQLAYDLLCQPRYKSQDVIGHYAVQIRSLRRKLLFGQLRWSAQEILRQDPTSSTSIYRKIQPAIKENRSNCLYYDSQYYGDPGLTSPKKVTLIEDLNAIAITVSYSDVELQKLMINGERMQSEVLYKLLDSFHQEFKKKYSSNHVFSIWDFTDWLTHLYGLTARRVHTVPALDDENNEDILDHIRDMYSDTEYEAIQSVDTDRLIKRIEEYCADPSKDTDPLTPFWKKLDLFFTFVLRVNEITTKEIATIMDCSPQSVYNRYGRILNPANTDRRDLLILMKIFSENESLPALWNAFSGKSFFSDSKKEIKHSDIQEEVEVAALYNLIVKIVDRHRPYHLYRDGTTEARYWYGLPGLRQEDKPVNFSLLAYPEKLPCPDVLREELERQPVPLLRLLDFFHRETAKKYPNENAFCVVNFADWLFSREAFQERFKHILASCSVLLAGLSSLGVPGDIQREAALATLYERVCFQLQRKGMPCYEDKSSRKKPKPMRYGRAGIKDQVFVGFTPEDIKKIVLPDACTRLKALAGELAGNGELEELSALLEHFRVIAESIEGTDAVFSLLDFVLWLDSLGFGGFVKEMCLPDQKEAAPLSLEEVSLQSLEECGSRVRVLTEAAKAMYFPDVIGKIKAMRPSSCYESSSDVYYGAPGLEPAKVTVMPLTGADLEAIELDNEKNFDFEDLLNSLLHEQEDSPLMALLDFFLMELSHLGSPRDRFYLKDFARWLKLGYGKKCP